MSREEKANTLTHLVPVIVIIPMIVPFILRSTAMGWTYIVTTCLFLAGMLNMFLASTCYHAAPEGSVLKRRLRVWDHSSIYVMIAASYSPLCSVFGGALGITMISVMWAFALAGIVGKIIALGKYPMLSLILYLAMGWMALVVLYWLWTDLTSFTFWMIVAEGICYTAGAYFFANDEKRPFFHAIWHVFIILGAACHTVAVYSML